MSDYLWDRSGPPDPEIEHLERLLAPLGHRGGLDVRRPVRPPARQRWWPAAVAASVVIGVAALQLVPRPAVHESAWEVVGVEGRAPLYTGQVLRTGPQDKATLLAGGFGRIEVAPETELRVLESGRARQRLGLPRGRIHVLVWAPPRQFVVDTPSARAVDLGCQYTLSVDARGNGLLTVETGWVAFQFVGRESFIPAGAACATSKGRGPGTPYFEDASSLLRRSLEAFDQTGDAAALRSVLAEARTRDGLTLWHLLARVPSGERGAVFDRFAQLVLLPPEVTRHGVLAKNPRMLDLCWNALHLENTDWWREWKRDWQP